MVSHTLLILINSSSNQNTIFSASLQDKKITKSKLLI